MIPHKPPVSYAVLFLAALATTFSGCPNSTHNPGPLDEDDVVLTREHQTTFARGATVDISIEIDVRDGVDITAIALEETMPAGWVYNAASHANDALPPILPLEGTNGVLNFVWIRPPLFPYTFTYTLEAPINATGTATLSGRVLYYTRRSVEAESTTTLTSTIQGP